MISQILLSSEFWNRFKQYRLQQQTRSTIIQTTYNYLKSVLYYDLLSKIDITDIIMISFVINKTFNS